MDESTARAAIEKVRLHTLTLRGLQRSVEAAVVERDAAVAEALAAGVPAEIVADTAEVSLTRRDSRWT